jgi:hypothetical protein
MSGWLRAKNDEAQKREAAIGCAILNRMLEMCERGFDSFNKAATKSTRISTKNIYFKKYNRQ